MRRAVQLTLVLASLSALVVLGCAKQGDGTDGGAGATAGDGGIASGDAATGVDCITEPNTGATICTSVSSCPTIAVDHDVYPHCGFRLQGNVAASLDIECICTDGYLCPVGVPATCDQASALLKGQNETTVCSQISEGRCTPPPSQAGGSTGQQGSGSSSSGGTGTSNCDRSCADECVNDPTCLKACGC